jgi:hypothetical protein
MTAVSRMTQISVEVASTARHALLAKRALTGVQAPVFWLLKP